MNVFIFFPIIQVSAITKEEMPKSFVQQRHGDGSDEAFHWSYCKEKGTAMAIMAKSMGEVTYKDISSLHKMGTSNFDLDGIVYYLCAYVS